METWVIILIAVLALIATLLFVVKSIAFPYEMMKNIGNAQDYYNKMKKGEIISMRFDDFTKDYKKNKSKYTLKPKYLMMLNREMKKTGRGMTLTPRYIHFTLIDKIKYMNWYKKQVNSW